MAGPTKSSSKGLKRKSRGSEPRPSKRARSESDNENSQAQILSLETEIFESKKNYNNIPKLIKLLRDSDDALIAAVSLCRVFTRLMVSGDLTRNKPSTEKETVVIKWLLERYAEYKLELLDLMKQEGAGSTSLTLCMRTLQIEGKHLARGQEYYFPTMFLRDLLLVLIRPEVEAVVRKEFVEKYLRQYDDLKFYAFETISQLNVENQSTALSTSNVLEILSAIDEVPESNEDFDEFYVPAPKKNKHALHSLVAHKKQAQAAWLRLMQLDMDREHRKAILGLMSSTIAPWFTRPELLMDFLTDSYNSGGSTSLLALSGLWYLIEEKNLDYPDFYRKLYSLLDMKILHSKHRSRFFRLVDKFLNSQRLLPAAIVASFIKRLSRLSLCAPPAGIVFVVPWIYNLLKSHPSCTFMIHREIRGKDAKEVLENEGTKDPFSMEEEDPMETNAIESCLWEIVTLQSHYHPNVATLAKIISAQFTKHRYVIEDFLDHSYGSMLDAELEKEVKKIPVVEYQIPKKIFMPHEAGSAVEDSLLVKLWQF